MYILDPGKIIFPLQSIEIPEQLGGKGQQIKWLQAAGFQVPKTFVIPSPCQNSYLSDPKRFIIQLERELTSEIPQDKLFAVRSSANVEDSATLSFAGQFMTLLDVRGALDICQAVEEIFLASQSPGLQSYLAKSEVSAEGIKMAILIQEMVPPVISGVAFSKNPITGMNEIIVEAIEGRGDTLLQGGETPVRWVSKWGDWTVQPEQNSIDEGVIRKVVGTTQEIEKLFGDPIDLEWVFDGNQLNWLQVRPITSLDNMQIYSNRISREFLPGIIKPLIWSINTPLVNGAWIELFSELIGPNDITPEDLAKSFYYRAYFNMGAIGKIFEILGFPRESLELLLGLEGGEDRPTFKPTAKTYRHLPRMLGFLIRRLRYDTEFEQAISILKSGFAEFAEKPLQVMNSTALLDLADTLIPITQQAARYNILTPLFQSIFTRLFKGQIEKLGQDYATFDLNRENFALEEFDPNPHLAALNAQFRGLPEEIQEFIRETSFENLPEREEVREFHASVLKFLFKFGHISESGNDFSVAPWRENPDIVLDMVMENSQVERENLKIGWEDLEIPALRQGLLRFLYNRTRKYHLYRESISSLYTFGYGLFRDIFLEIGERLVNEASLVQRDDIFYLDIDEIKSHLTGTLEGTQLQPLVDQRKAAIESSRDAVLPDLIYGDHPPPLEDEPDLDKLKGVPTSRGYYKGVVKVVESAQEFGKLNPGDVLVIPYSDVAWTPLFGRAGAVIAEAGGILSHSSIVAREFNIPCVVSVNNACRLPENTTVTVNGYTGEITVHP